jgi:hypothetical protein
MDYKFEVRRNGVLLDRTLTRGRAVKIAARYIGAVVIAVSFVSGCAGPGTHPLAIPCDRDNCGKNPNGGK